MGINREMLQLNLISQFNIGVKFVEILVLTISINASVISLIISLDI